MANKSKNLIVYVERSSLTFYGGLIEKPLKLDFNEKTIFDMEIVDKKSLADNILSQIKKTENTMDLIIVFSEDSSFTKEIPINSTNEQLEAEEKSFVSLVPFDKIAHKLIKFVSKYQLVAVNREMYTSLSEVLTPLGYNLSMVLPSSVVGIIDQKTILSESLKSYSLFEVNSSSQNVGSKNINKTSKNYLPILVGVFILLLVVLAVLLVSRS